MQDRKILFASILILFMGLITTQLQAEKTDLFAGELYGEVEDSITGDKLAEVTITLQETETTATTNSDGEFSFEYLEPGFYTVVIEHEGYTEWSQTVELTDEGLELEIRLHPEPEPEPEPED